MLINATIIDHVFSDMDYFSIIILYLTWVVSKHCRGGGWVEVSSKFVYFKPPSGSSIPLCILEMFSVFGWIDLVSSLSLKYLILPVVTSLILFHHFYSLSTILKLIQGPTIKNVKRFLVWVSIPLKIKQNEWTNKQKKLLWVCLQVRIKEWQIVREQ